MAPGHVVQFVGPAQTRVKVATQTLGARLADEGLPTSFSSAPFRRVLRPTPSPSRRETPVRISLQRVATRMGARPR